MKQDKSLNDMKSIKEKAEELYRIPRGDDTEDTVALDLDKAVTFTEGAYYVLDAIEEWLRTTDYTSYKSAEHDLWVLIEQLKN